MSRRRFNIREADTRQASIFDLLSADMAAPLVALADAMADARDAQNESLDLGSVIIGTSEPVGPPKPQAEELLVDWYKDLNEMQCLGSIYRPGSMAGIAAAREKNLGQFFTPSKVVKFMWDLITPAVNEFHTPSWAASSYASGYRPRQTRLVLFDNSFGSGRMYQFAKPEDWYLSGIELDGEAVAAVSETLTKAGFEFFLQEGSMEEFRPAKVDLAMINPPFSIILDSENCETYETGTYGRFGPNSSHKSEVYALHQAMDASDIVMAVLPRNFAKSLLNPESPFNGRLYKLFHLPKGAFKQEGTEWDTSVALFSGRTIAEEDKEVHNLTSLEVGPQHVIDVDRCSFGSSGHYSCPEIKRVAVERAAAASELPVTNSTKVSVCHSGRRLVLKFECALAYTTVMNRIYAGHITTVREKDEGRLPANLRFKGEGKMDLMNYICQPFPMNHFKKLVADIEGWGFDVTVDPGVVNYIRTQTARKERLTTPLAHVAYVADGGIKNYLMNTPEFKARVRERIVIRQEVRYTVATREFFYPEIALEVGDIQTISQVVGREGEDFGVAYVDEKGNELLYATTRPALLARFELMDFTSAGAGWTTIHKGGREKYANAFAEVERRAKSFGLDKWLTWGYQWADLIECSARRGNTLIGWEMGLGKARLSLALCYMAGKNRKSVLLVEARLISEMKIEIAGLGIPADEWQVIEGIKEARDLKRINLISYSTLRKSEDYISPLRKREKRRYPIADAMRGRIHTMVADECHNLKNRDADQTKAAWRVGAKQRYGMTGTAIDNYPRDILPVLQWIAGDGVYHQAFGHRKPFLKSENLANMDSSIRGIDQFRNMFVTTSWVTNEFSDTLSKGAKREIPKIADLRAFRNFVSPLVKRRLMEEPEVAAHIKVPKSTRIVTKIEWDMPHLERYLRVSAEFVAWWKAQREAKTGQTNQNNLIALLAQIGAVIQACNYPQQKQGNEPALSGLTSKQTYSLDRLQEWVAEGHKAIFFAESPKVCELMSRELLKRNIKSVTFHGEIAIGKRNKAMDTEFRNGTVPVLLGTKGALQTGYNIYQATRVLFYDGTWSHKTERQAAGRALRPQQTQHVLIEHLELTGSIDTYQHQMVEYKGKTSDAGLDYGEDDLEVEDFQHIETILGTFVKDFEATHGVELKRGRGGIASRPSSSGGRELAAQIPTETLNLLETALQLTDFQLLQEAA